MISAQIIFHFHIIKVQDPFNAKIEQLKLIYKNTPETFKNDKNILVRKNSISKSNFRSLSLPTPIK